RVSQGENVTLFMLLETVFALLVGRYSQEKDVVIGTAVAGRVHEEVEGLIGFFVNNLVLRSRLEGAGAGESMREFLGEQKRMILEGYGHQQVPFEKLVEELNPERDTGRDPIFQIVFRVEEGEGEELE